jgi:Spy/CpxP family protein refolding chaperone
MVAGVREGKIDRAKIETAVGQGREAHKAAQIAALDGLYAALTPAQRQELAAGVKARHAEREGREGRGFGKGRHHGEHGGMRAERLVEKLDLDAAQQRAVEAIVQKREAAPLSDKPGAEMRARMDALLTAFAADGFSAAKQDMGPPAGMTHDPALSHADFLAELLPVLRADQREKLALSMEQRHERRGHKGEAPAE